MTTEPRSLFLCNTTVGLQLSVGFIRKYKLCLCAKPDIAHFEVCNVDISMNIDDCCLGLRPAPYEEIIVRKISLVEVSV